MNDRLGSARERGERWGLLLAMLAEHGRLSVAQVCRELGVSEATARRDFTELAAQQLVTRTHGGVVASSVAYDLPARYKSSTADQTKQAIATAAADLVTVGSVVGLNGGTTTSAVARRIAARRDLSTAPERPAITIVTNALNIATEMVLRPFIRCVTLGGVARSESYEQSGPLASMVLEQLWLDTLILGVDALSAATGATCQHEGEAGINALMVARADRVIVVATGEKIGGRGFARICQIADVDILVTDERADAAHLAQIRDAGVLIDVVEADERADAARPA